MVDLNPTWSNRRGAEASVDEDGERQDKFLGNLDEDATTTTAPRYPIPRRRLAAVEVPAIVRNVDRAIKAFGRNSALPHALDPLRQSVPLYLNPESPFCKPLISHNAASHNVVLKVTVPKRTGRKRKRGSGGPWQGDAVTSDVGSASTASTASEEQVCSQSRLDDPRLLRAKLADNVGKYSVEAVGVIKNTHRFRALADFYWDMSNRSDFARRYATRVLAGDVEEIKNFKFTPGFDKGPKVDVIPPPVLTHMSLPFNYAYTQNPYVRVTKDGGTFNATALKQVGYFIPAEAPTPTAPQHAPNMSDPRVVEALAELEQAFATRPLWTRRALLNHLTGKLRSWNELKKHLSYVAYQFKGGPWRDAVCPYGLDPRQDPQYRVYQTLMFKLRPKSSTSRDKPPSWYSLRADDAGFVPSELESHLFNGETYHTDGKVWQVCDITDPLLRRMLEDGQPRMTRDGVSGWYHGGLWAKVKAIMKTKLVAIRFQRHLTDSDFSAIVQAGDQTPTKANAVAATMPLPNLDLSRDELTQLNGRRPPRKAMRGYSVKVRERTRAEDGQDEPDDATGELGDRVEPAQWLEDDDDEGEGDDEDEDEDDEDDDGDGDDDEDENNMFLAGRSGNAGEVTMEAHHSEYPDVPLRFNSS